MKILINQSGPSGDAVLSTSMAKLIKDKFPEAHVTFLASSKAADVFKHSTAIDEVVIYHRQARFYSKIREIIKIFARVRPTHYLYAGGGYLPNFIAWLTRVAFRGGHKSRWHTYLFLNKGVRQKRSMVTMHEMEYNLNLLAPLNMDYNYLDFEKYAPVIRIPQDLQGESWNLFQKHVVAKGGETGRKIIFIHPTASPGTLNWSPRNYGRFILKMEQRFPEKFMFVISHTEADHVYLQGVKEILARKENEFLQNRVIYFNESKHGLKYHMGVLSQAQLFVGPRSDMTHIAAALGVPTVSLYSPIKIQSTLRFGPLFKSADKIKTLVPDVICGEIYKCAERSCPYYECMGKIEVEDVYKQAMAIMEL